MGLLSASYIFTLDSENPRPFISTVTWIEGCDAGREVLHDQLDFSPADLLFTRDSGMVRTLPQFVGGDCISGVSILLLPPVMRDRSKYGELH